VYKGDKKNLSDTVNWKLATEKFEKTKQRIDGQFPDEKSSEVLKESLQKIMLLCKANNIELVGIKFPLATEFLKQLGKKSFHADSVFIKSNLPVLDYKYLYINEDQYFSNQDHLNDTGANLFIKKFIADNNIKKQAE
ncbi:MAG: hypothetical protein LH629_05930, partial [Ignavibacteria bacterium]|nr:hypothetical protein [Ignavibacteria bacterium]